MPLNAGQLNTPVCIYRLDTPVEQDAAGQPVRDWVVHSSPWASVRHLSGMETIRADRETSVVRASIRIRHDATVTSAMRVHLGSTVYEIKAALHDEAAHEFTDLVCELING